MALWQLGSLVLAAGLLIPAAPCRAQPWADTRQARPFACRADFRLLGYEPLLVELQQLQHELVRMLDVPPSAEPIELYLFQDKDAYRAFLERHHPGAPARRALFVKNGGPGQVFAYRSDEFEIDVRHESTHALLHASLPVVPLWLDEGLAEYFEVPADQRAGHNPHLAALKWSLRLGLVPKLSTLESKHDLDEMGRREYMFAWAWVHFLLHGPAAARQELVAYLADLQAGVPTEPLSVRLARRLPQAEKQLTQHFRAWNR